ncbi:3-oxoadipate enol-lactonase [Nordella sp. HKS 07]|uniref:3-oxoadipate enol-lactonase n=1 Tax=Nordella sp. HKS 07 TaxID=2712222 RepID=UPI0013E1828E|nr:3-oxoadipate enol-lactonase [Nordella sp. HKS 07]QIG49982.1 3-oxoadipate enol-lactonase [Nordella sp. HKS 07]
MPFGWFNDLVLHFEDEGPANAPALVFVNSLGTDLRIWDKIAAQLRVEWRILRYDLRGHGLSDTPSAPYAIDDHIGDLAALMDARGVKAALVVGLSVGGLIALALASRRPDLARALVLSDTAHKIGTGEMWDARILAVRQGGMAAIAQSILVRWFAVEYPVNRPADFAGYRNMLIRTPVEGYIGTCATLRDADLTAVASELALPALCLAGAEDGATPPDLVRSLAALLPGARFEMIPGAGHLPCVEQPEIMAKHISAFAREAVFA